MNLPHIQIQDERQLAWDQREVELERQLDQYEKHQSEVLSGAERVSQPSVSLDVESRVEFSLCWCLVSV